ncbi:MAG TPA: hypothetical protein VN372_07575 [Methanospirillum sp.]|nr:hypothetical protein [Methanospirillum sp.]
MEVTGTRVLTPGEVDRFRSVMGRPSNRIVFDALLSSGIRYAELSQIWEDPSRFAPERKLIVVDNQKLQAQKRAGTNRVVYLSDYGSHAMAAFLRLGKKPVRYDKWLSNLKRWCHLADIAPLPGMINETTPEQMDRETIKNIWGISVKSTRKMWECFLFSSFPDRSDLIAESQGHSLAVSLKHYRKWHGAFTAEERSIINEYTAGWLE